MLNQLDVLAERVGGSNELVDSWLEARRQLLVTYYHLVGLKPKKEALTRLDEQALDNFCHGLVDYLSAGHFSIYERVISEMSGDSPMVAAAQIYPPLEANTERLMQLYDGHLQQAIDDENCMTFQQALSEVGEVLESRFTLEDKLIQLAWDNQLATPPVANDSHIARPA
ncbi:MULTISPECIES: sigma D regulator [Pantoea]|uniref:sigma D regulator n=1 Tax=Pantoea TaxID=53335 RepID=UPI0023AF1577|nr:MULTISPECIES: sigma D regulator [Pantoea]MDE8559159.1 sigma D regulator [Pantoea vagans]MDE8579154.1 sigma D regulator [Pantoea vagans]GME48029.1 Rsd/AlgQ family anti-sigma factor [Pantoea sp. QMID3]GME62891.1 Rsd/AlgQ family anti-sigma factor [Pantoea sp. QMID4]GME64025.1 Rsd/AlgQ family anti-sigma factor [Pantoea sp. QMID2]